MQISAGDFPNFLCDKQKATTTGRSATINNQKKAKKRANNKIVFVARFHDEQSWFGANRPF